MKEGNALSNYKERNDVNDYQTRRCCVLQVLLRMGGQSCVDISVEPHFVRNKVSNELMDLSKKYTIYGLCDDSFIVCSRKTIEFFGEIYKLSQGKIERL